MSDCCIVTTTSDKRDSLEAIAKKLIELRLAACCQISGPVESHYRWEGKVESAEEWICTAKTTTARLEEVISQIKSLHHYDEPEIIATPIVGGSDGYLNWIREQVGS